MPRHLVLEADHLVHHRDVLRRDGLHGLDAVHEIVDALRAEQHARASTGRRASCRSRRAAARARPATRPRFARAACNPILLIFRLCSMTPSFAEAESYALCARCRLESSCWIWPMTCCAWACFALTEGSPVAVPAAMKAAATTRRSTGACRFRTLITDSRESLAAGAPEGPVRHKFGRLAGVSDACNSTKGTKLPQLRPRSCSNLGVAGPHKVAEIPAVSWLVSRDRERPKGTVRGDARRPRCGVVLAVVSAAAAAGPGAERRDAAGPGERARRADAHGAARPLRPRHAGYETAQVYARVARVAGGAACGRSSMLLTQQIVGDAPDARDVAAGLARQSAPPLRAGRRGSRSPSCSARNRSTTRSRSSTT